MQPNSLVSPDVKTVDSAKLSTTIEAVEKKREEFTEKKSKQEKANSEKLIKAIVDLTKKINAAGKEKPGDKKDGRFTLKDFLQDKKQQLKSLTSVKGLADMGAARTSGITSALFGSLGEYAESKERKKAEALAKQRKPIDFVATVMTGTTYGRSLSKTDPKAQEKVLDLYNKKEAALAKREKILAEKAVLEEEGKKTGVTTTLSDDQQQQLEEADKTLKDIEQTLAKSAQDLIKAYKPNQFSGWKDAAVQPTKEGMTDEEAEAIRKELKEAVREGMAAEADTLHPFHKEQISKDPEYMKGVLQGVDSEIDALSKQQLEELIKINAALEEQNKEKDDDDVKQKEDSIEKKQKPDLIEKKEPQKEKKESSLISKALEKSTKFLKGPLSQLTNIVKSVPKVLGKMMPPVLRPLGGLLSKFSPATPKEPGQEQSGGIMDTVMTAGGSLLSGALGGAARGALIQGVSALAPVAGVAAAGTAGYYGAKALGADELGSYLGNKAYDTVDWLKGALGGKTDKQKIDDAESAAQEEQKNKKLAQAAMQSELLKADATSTAAQDIRKLDNAQTADVIAAAVEDKEKREKDSETKKGASTNIVNAPSQVVNNNTTTYTKQPTRNEESSFVRQMERRFVY